MPATKTFTESELRAIRTEAADLEKQAEDAHTRASERVAEIRDAGTDPLRDKEAFTEVDELWKEADEARQRASELRDRYTRALEANGDRKVVEPEARGGDELETRGTTAGERLVRSDNYERMRAALSEDIGNAVRQFGAVEVATRAEARGFLFPVQTRSGVQTRSLSLSGEALIMDDRESGITDPYAYRPVRVLDLVGTAETDSDKIDYVVEDTPTENAAETAYGSDPSSASTLPESDYGFTEQSASVFRIGHYIPVTEAQLADAAQLRSLLDSRLRGGVRRELERLVLNGSTGGGDPWDGILNSGITSIARDTANGESRHDAAHRGITQVRLNSFEEPQVIGFHPNDFEELTLEKDSNGNYLNGRGVNEPSSVWGLRPVVTPLFPEGTVLVGNYNDGATVWLRDGVSVAASDQHSDWFLKGWVAIKAQVRSAFATTRPVLFCEVTSM